MPKVWNLGSAPMVDGDVSISPGCGRFVDSNGLRRLSTKYPSRSYFVGPALPAKPAPPKVTLEIKDTVAVADKVDLAKALYPPSLEDLGKATKTQLKKWAEEYEVYIEGNPTKKELRKDLEQHFYPVGDNGHDEP